MTRADVILLLLTLLTLPLVYNHYWGERGAGANAVVAVADSQPATISLNDDRRIDVNGARGTSVIEVHGGAVRFVDSPCNSKQCIHAGWLRLSGDFAACLPNKVSVLITGNQRRFDAINF